MSKERSNQFKTGLNLEKAQSKRAEKTISLRKKKREDNLRQRRRMNDDAPAINELGVALFPPSFDLDMCVEWCKSDETRVKGVMGIRTLLGDETNPPIQDVIDRDLVSFIVECLKSDDLSLVFESCWVLTNISSGTQEETYAVVEKGAVDYLVQLALHPFEQIAEQAIWTLGNITGEIILFRDYVLQRNAVSTIVQALQRTDNISLLGTSAWAISNFCRGKPDPQWQYVGDVLQVIPKLLDCNDSRIVTDTCWILSFLTDGNYEHIQHVIDSGVCLQFISLLSSPSFQIQIPALRTLGNIVCGTTEQTDYILGLNVLDRLRLMMKSPKKIIRKEACWVASNVAAGPDYQKQMLMETNIWPEITRLIQNDDYDIRKEAIWALANACSGNEEQKEYLITIETIEVLAPFLESQDSDTICLIIEAFVRLLIYNQAFHRDDVKYRIEACGALRVIEHLSINHQSADITKKCDSILKDYFPDTLNSNNQLPPEFSKMKLPGGGTFSF